MDRGRYGEMAARHWVRWLPSTYAAIPAADRDAWFAALDEQVTERIADRSRSLMPPETLADTDHQEYLGQVRMAQVMAEEQVLAEMVLLEPEPGLESESDEPETDETGAWVDRGWNPPRLEMTDQEWADRQAEGDWMPLPGRQAPQGESPNR